MVEKIMIRSLSPLVPYNLAQFHNIESAWGMEMGNLKALVSKQIIWSPQ